MKRALVTAALAVCVAFLGCGGESMPTVPDTPDGTVTAVASGLADGKPQILWAAMPASYQKDVTGIVHEFAEKMDPEVYDKGVSLVKKLVQVLREKKDLIVKGKMLEQAKMDPKEAAAKWDEAVGLLDTLVSSELGSLDSLKKVDVGKFLQTTGAKVMQNAAEVSKASKDDPYNQQFVKNFKGVTAEVVKSDEKTATLKVTMPDESAKDGKTTKEVEMVRVEDRWVPKEMADDWAKTIAEAKEGLAGMSESVAKNKEQALAMMGKFEPVLDEMLKAETQEEFEQVMGKAMMSIMGGLMMPKADKPTMPDMPMPTPPADPTKGPETPDEDEK